MNSDDTQKLRALVEKATPGPWDTDGSTSVGAGEEWLAHLTAYDDGSSLAQARADAAFIAAARDAVPALLDRLAAVEAKNERLEAVEGRLSELLWDLTGGLLSKTGYDVRTMVQAVEAEFEKYAQEDRQEVVAERDAAREALAAEQRKTEAVRALIDNPKDAHYPIVARQWVRDALGEDR